MKEKFNFDKIKDEKTIVGGLANGEYGAILTGFDVNPDRNGDANYQFELTLVDYEGVTRKYNTSKRSKYKEVVSDIGIQLGFESHLQDNDVAILTKATEKPFSIWINDSYINFHDFVTAQKEKYSEIVEEEPEI